MFLEVRFQGRDFEYYKFDNKVKNDFNDDLFTITNIDALKEWLQTENYINVVVIHDIVWNKARKIEIFTTGSNAILTVDLIEHIAIV